MEVFIRLVMSLYEGAKTIVRLDSEWSEELAVKVWMHQCFVLSTFLFAVVVDVMANLAMEDELSEWMYVGNLVLLSEIIGRLRNRIIKWK